jgi:hypothetical protein
VAGWGRWRCGAEHPTGAVQAASSRRANHASRGPRDGGAGNRSQVRRTRPGPTAVDRRPANSRGEAGRLKREVHRGGDGANLKHRARDAMETADLRQYGLRQASMLRGVEVRESSRTLASRAPSVLFESGGQYRNTAYPAPLKEYGRRSVGFSRPHPEERPKGASRRMGRPHGSRRRFAPPHHEAGRG